MSRAPSQGGGFAFLMDGLDPQLFESQQKRRREADGADGAEGAGGPSEPSAKRASQGYEFPKKFDWFRFKASPKSSVTFRT
jgi:hypothetical protein